jgi:hypothetical protein
MVMHRIIFCRIYCVFVPAFPLLSNSSCRIRRPECRFATTSMNSSYNILPSRPVYPHIATSCSRCNSALEFPVPSQQPRPGTLLQVRCFSCQNVISHAFYPNQVPSTTSHNATTASDGARQQSQQQRKSRKIGTQDRPLETGYYDILGVPVTATTDDIKKAYRTFSWSQLLESSLTCVSFSSRPVGN